MAEPDLGDGEKPRFIDKRNAARLLGGITVKYLEILIKNNELEAVNIGKRRMVVLESLDAYVQRKRDEEAQRRAAETAA